METLITILIIALIIEAGIGIVNACTYFGSFKRSRKEYELAFENITRERQSYAESIQNKDRAIASYAEEAARLRNYTNKNGLLQFNLNDYVLVQLTEKGKKKVIESAGQEYFDSVIKPKETIIGDTTYYKLQAHQLMSLWEPADWLIAFGPIEPTILISWADVKNA